MDINYKRDSKMIAKKHWRFLLLAWLAMLAMGLLAMGGQNVANGSTQHPNAHKVVSFISQLSSHPRLLPLDSFETNWTANAGTITYDTTKTFDGTRSVKVVTAGGNGQITIAKSGISLRNSSFSLWAYTDDYTSIDSISLFASYTGDFSIYGKGRMVWGYSNMPTLNSRWFRLDLAYFDEVTTESDELNYLRIQVKARTGREATIWLDDLRYAQRETGGIVTLSFDDNLNSALTKAKPYMDKYGYKGVEGVITSYPAAGLGLSVADLLLMQSTGWDISPHGNTHTYNLSTKAEIEAELLGAKSWMYENGFVKGARFYLLPGGVHNSTLVEVAQDYYTMVRGAGGSYEGEGSIATMKYPVQGSYTVVASTSLATIQGILDRNAAKGIWTQLVFHNIVASGATGAACNEATFKGIIDYIHTKGIKVATYSEIYDRLL